MTVRRPMESEVYRVSPGPVNTWRVYVDPAREIASFNDRSSAVGYAMRLARSSLTWQPLAVSAVGSSRTAAS